MGYGIGLALFFQVILIVANAKKLSDIDTSSSESLGDDDSALTDSEEYSKVNKEYQKYLGEMEVKYYKDLFNKAQSKEEKDEVAYYENILKNVKKLNRPDYKRINRQGGKDPVIIDPPVCPEVPRKNKEEHYFDQLIMKQQELNRQMMAKYYKELFEAKNRNRSKVVTFDKDLLDQIDEINLKILTGNGKYKPSHHKSIKRQAKVVWHDDEDDPAVTIPPGCPGSKGLKFSEEFDKKIKYYEQLIRKRQELHNLMMTKYYEDIKEAENPRNVKYDQALLDQIEEINKEIIMEHYQIHDGPTTESSYQTYLQEDHAKQKEKSIEQQSSEELEEQPEDQGIAATVHEPDSKKLPEEEDGDILIEDGVDVAEPEKPQGQKPKEQPRDKERFHDDVEAGDDDDENPRGGIGGLSNFGYGGLIYGGKPPLRVKSPYHRPPHKKLVARIDVLNSELMTKYHKEAFDSEKANLDEEVLKQIKDINRQLVSRYNNNLTKSVKRDITRNMEKHQDKHLNRALLKKLSSRN